MSKLPSKTIAEAMADFGSAMRYGSPSVTTWQRACEASQRRADRRRQEPRMTTVARLLDLGARLLILLLIIGLAWAVATVLSGGSYK